MRTFTKLALAAASGYAFKSYMQRDSKMTEEIFDRNANYLFGGLKQKTREKIYNWTYNKISDLIYPPTQAQRHGATWSNDYTRQTPGPSRYARSYPTTSRYSRFGRNRNSR